MPLRRRRAPQQTLRDGRAEPAEAAVPRGELQLVAQRLPRPGAPVPVRPRKRTSDQTAACWVSDGPAPRKGLEPAGAWLPSRASRFLQIRDFDDQTRFICERGYFFDGSGEGAEFDRLARVRSRVEQKSAGRDNLTATAHLVGVGGCHVRIMPGRNGRRARSLLRDEREAVDARVVGRERARVAERTAADGHLACGIAARVCEDSAVPNAGR